MSVLLPSTVEEINNYHNSFLSPPSLKDINTDFEDIPVERVRFKREYSLPSGVENWNIGNFDPYLNFEDHNPQGSHKVTSGSQENDRLVPQENEFRQRCESFSSVSSSMDDKCLTYQNLGVKTFSTVRMDSGSTCISSVDVFNSLVSPMSSTPAMYKGLDAEDTYQNLDSFCKQEATISSVPSLSPPSSVGSPLNDTNLEFSALSNFSVSSTCSQDSFNDLTSGIKRCASGSMVDNDIFMLGPSKRSCDSPVSGHYSENRKRNNAASKSSRKTRKEKQKDMDKRVIDLEKEKGQLTVQVQLLEEVIQAHKVKLYAILKQKRCSPSC